LFICTFIRQSPSPAPFPYTTLFRSSNGVQKTREPVRVPAHEEFDLLPRLCVPLWEGERLCGHIWLIDSPEISAADVEVITRYRQPIIDLMAARDETFVRRVAEMREIARDVTLVLDGSLAHAVDNNFLPRRGVIRIHQLTIREVAESPAEIAEIADAPERLMLELLRF